MTQSFFNKFNGNPFLRIICTDYLDLEPFIETEITSFLKSHLLQTIESITPFSWHQIIRGDNGTGKTSHLLFLGKIIRERHSPDLIDDYIRGIEDTFKSPFHLLIHLVERLNESIPNQISNTISMSEFQKEIKKILKERRYFFLIDMPDSLNKKNLDDFLNTLEYLIGIPNISIIIALNIAHFEKSFAYSEILKKFNTDINLRSFTLEETKNLITERLNTVSPEPNGLYPFTEDAIKIIHKVSFGNPRLIITKCDKLFSSAFFKNIKIIDYEFAENVLQKTHVADTLNQKIPDPTVRKTLSDVYFILKNEMSGSASTQKQFVNKVKEVGLCKNHITILKKINKLVELKVILKETDPEDGRSFIYRCIV